MKRSSGISQWPTFLLNFCNIPYFNLSTSFSRWAELWKHTLKAQRGLKWMFIYHRNRSHWSSVRLLHRKQMLLWQPTVSDRNSFSHFKQYPAVRFLFYLPQERWRLQQTITAVESRRLSKEHRTWSSWTSGSHAFSFFEMLSAALLRPRATMHARSSVTRLQRPTDTTFPTVIYKSKSEQSADPECPFKDSFF